MPQYEQQVLSFLKRVCFKCFKVIPESKKCQTCKRSAPSVKGIHGHRIDVMFDNAILKLTPSDIQDIFMKLDSHEQKQLGINGHVQSMICNNIFISPIMIRPDKRIQSTVMKTQDDYTISL